MAKVREPEKFRVFISYSRRDSKAADDLVEALSARGFDVTIDRRDLPFGEKWQAELADFIRLSDTVVWLVSEASVQSKWVNWELDEVAKRNKRLVPVMIAEADRGALPRQIGEIHILPADRVYEEARDLDTLVQVLETDHGWLKQASHYQDRAAQWIKSGRVSSRLLSRGELNDAEKWKDTRPAKAPQSAPEVLDLMLASRKAVTRRQRLWTVGTSLASIFAFVLAAFAFFQKSEAVSQRDTALRGQSLYLADRADQMLSEGDVISAINLAIEALPNISRWHERPFVIEAEKSLLAAVHRDRELLRATTRQFARAAVSPNRRLMAVSESSGKVRIFSTRSGKQVSELDEDGAELLASTFSHDGEFLLTTDWPRMGRVAVRLWSVKDELQVAERVVTTGFLLPQAKFCPDRSKIAIYVPGGSVVIWQPASNTSIEFTPEDHFDDVQCNASGQYIVLEKSSGGVELWDLSSKNRIGWRNCSLGCVYALSPNGEYLAIADASDKEEKPLLWKIGEPQSSKLETNNRLVAKMTFSRDSQHLVVAGEDGLAKVFSAPAGKLISDLVGHTGRITAIDTQLKNDNDLFVLTGGTDNTVRLWDGLTGQPHAGINAHNSNITEVTFGDYDASGPGPEAADDEATDDDFIAASADAAGSAIVWNFKILRSPREMHRFRVSDSPITSLTFGHMDTSLIVENKARQGLVWSIEEPYGLYTNSIDAASEQARLVAMEFGNKVMVHSVEKRATISEWPNPEHDDIYTRLIEFSYDGKYIVSCRGDNTVRIRPTVGGEEVKISGIDGQIVDITSGRSGWIIATGTGKIHFRNWDGTLARSPIETGLAIRAITSDGSTRLALATDQLAGLIDVNTASKIRTLAKANDAHGFVDVAFSEELLVFSTSSKLYAWRQPIVDRNSVVVSGMRTDPSARLQFNVKGTRLIWGDAIVDSKTLDILHWGSREKDRYVPGRYIVGDKDVRSRFKELKIERHFQSAIDLVDYARSAVPACLPLSERRPPLSKVPPRWCITGPEREADLDQKTWQPKWPYQTPEWRDWLVAHDRGDERPFPTDQSNLEKLKN